MSEPDEHPTAASSAVEDGFAATAGPKAAPAGGPGSAVAVGEELAGRYRVLALLGRGGMGEVFAVHDVELDEEVALKLLRAELSRDLAYRQRLRGEVRLARRVSHPNVCRVHDLGQHHDHLFVTMELVRGPTLRARLRDLQAGAAPAMPLAAVVDVIVQLCSALAAAHRAGVLHRDVKPDNVILEDGRAVLTDFGVATLASDDDAHVVAGTPSYVAPEILRGEPIDPRADVYAASVLAYELLAGRVPFAIRSMNEAIRRAASPASAPPLPAAVGPAPLRDALDRVLAAGLASDPARRLPTVDRLAEGLAAAVRGDAALGGLPVPRPESSPPAPTPPESASSAATTAGVRRAEVRVATVLAFVCDEVTASPAPESAPVSVTTDGVATEIVPISLPGDDLERPILALGGLPITVTDRSVTALFGAPVALGDDAIRAVRAATHLLARTRGGRAGLDTVRVMLRPGAAEPVTPDALRHAEALVGAAPPGETWLSAAAARQVAAHVEVATIPDVAGQRTLRITGVAGLAAAPAPAEVVRPRELARAEALARACFEGRTPTFVEVRGPAGAGKSRLRDALIARVSERREVDWLLARAAPLGEAAPLSLLRSAEPAWFDAAARAPDRAGMLAAARRWLEGRATRRPVAVVFEDLQWADEVSRALIGHLAGHLEGVPVLVLTVARDDGGLDTPGAHVIALGPIDDDTALRLAREAAPAASDDQLADVVARAGGNPYFVEELARELADGGGTLPPTVEAAVQARLDRLPARAVDVAGAAAVVGRAFWREAVRAAIGEPAIEDAELDAALAELERRGLVHPAPPATVDDDRYEFTQAVVRDVAYARLPARDRRGAHARVARWLGRAAGPGGGDDPDVLYAIAHHEEAAGATARAAQAWRLAGMRALDRFAYRQAHTALGRAWQLAGGAGSGDGELAERLGDAALEGATVEAAEEAFTAALALAGDPATRARLLLRLGDAAAAAAAHARAVTWYEQGLAIAPGLGNARLESLLHGGLGWVLAYQLSSPDPRGLTSCERAVQLLEGTPHTRELGRALSRLGGAYMRAGRWTEQLACNRRTLELALAQGDPAAQLTARINLGVVLLNLGDVDGAIAHTEEALALCRRTGARVVEGLAASNLAGYLIERGDLDGAARWLAHGIRLLERTGSRRVLPESRVFQARLAARRGDLEAAAATAAAAVAAELAIDLDLGIARRVLAQVEARRGDVAAARRALDDATARLADADPVEVARCDAAWARVLGRAGDAAGAAAARARAVPVFERLGAALDLRMVDDVDDVR